MNLIQEELLKSWPDSELSVEEVLNLLILKNIRVSRNTIRRHLVELEESNKLIRTKSRPPLWCKVEEKAAFELPPLKPLKPQRVRITPVRAGNRITNYPSEVKYACNG